MAKSTSNENFHILIAEDDPDDVDFLRAALRRIQQSHHLTVVNDGEEALKFLTSDNKNLPDLIFLDLNMPKIDGYRVLETIKEDTKLKHIPVIVMTTASDHESIMRAYQMHANSFITKPPSFNELTQIVDSIAEYWLSSVGLPSLQ